MYPHTVVSTLPRCEVVKDKASRASAAAKEASKEKAGEPGIMQGYIRVILGLY